MITGELKNKIDRIWESFWSGGIANPIDVIEQFTYLLFIKNLDDIETTKENDAALLGVDFEPLFPNEFAINNSVIDGQNLRWSVFKNFGAEEMYNNYINFVFPFIKQLSGNEESAYARYMGNSINKIPSANLLQKVVEGIDQLPIDTSDTKGDLYEYLLSKLSTSGTNGQFRTPRHIIDMMVELLQPQDSDVICDPASGTSGFLVSAQTYLRKNHPEIFLDEKKKEHFNSVMFNGFDIDTTMLRIGAMNLMMHGVDDPNLKYQDSLSSLNEEANKYTMILANPPFKGSLDYDSVSDDLLKITRTKKTELLFLTLFIRLLKVGGRCASIVPDGVLFGSSNAHKSIRKEIIENHKLEAIISMPSGVFKPYAGVSTAIIIFTKTNTGGTDKVWFYDMKNDGFTLDDKRTDINDNDIPDIIERFRNLENESERKRTEQSFFVEKQEIVDNDYDLSINKYKEIEYEKIEYPPTEDILKEIFKLNEEINKELEELKSLLNND
ncbi:MAG: N-6 DNA methylase [Longibaculum sp.]